MNMQLSEMTQAERSLLLYLESVAVDYGGLVHSQRINAEDREILERWDKQGLISYSRLTWESVQTLHDKHNTSLVRLSEEAWRLAHEERRARYIRISSRPPICDLKTTKTKNAEFVLAEEEGAA
jgi:hypothetical protein